MVVVPLPMAVTTPVDETDAICGSALANVTCCSSGRFSTTSENCSPGLKNVMSVLFSSGGSFSSVPGSSVNEKSQVTRQVADCVPQVTVTVVLPPLTATILPCALMVAIDSSAEV